MKKNRTRIALIVLLAAALIVPASLVVAGCGGGGVNLSYDESGSNAVIVYRASQAIAPIYNSSAPESIVYGDDTVIKKEDSYALIKGTVGSGGVEGILEDLKGEGFFKLKRSYSGDTPRAGGVTEVLTVKLTEKIYEVTVESGSEPTGWDEIVATVTGMDVTGFDAYIPEEISLYAKAETDPGGLKVMAWPGEQQDLKDAAASGGVKLEGEEAAVAWDAVWETYEKVDDIVWQGGDSYYTYVYASPVFPGVE